VSASLLTLALAVPAVGAEPVDLGAAATYSVLAPSLTSNGPTAMSEDLGSTVAVAGDAAPIVLGQTRIGGPAAPAQADLDLAYGDAVLRPGVPFGVADLAGATLTPGVYYSTAAMGFTAGGTLTLDGGGDPDAVFILQIGGALSVGASAQVALIGDADPCNVFWAVNGATTIGATSRFAGTVMADLGITVGAGSRVDGRLLADKAAITLASTAVRTACAETVLVPGPVGPAGPVGPPGADGSDGSDGTDGLPGVTGPAGPAGPAGDDGAVGPTGSMGPAGPTGFTGLTGPIGPTGLIGLMGPIGGTGPAGPAGLTGPAGPAGTSGAESLRRAAALCVTVRSSPRRARPGALVRWAIGVRNCGGRPAHQVLVTARPRADGGLRASGGGRLVGERLRWTTGTLAVGARRSYAITTRVAAAARPGPSVMRVAARGANASPADGSRTVVILPAA